VRARDLLSVALINDSAQRTGAFQRRASSLLPRVGVRDNVRLLITDTIAILLAVVADIWVANATGHHVSGWGWVAGTGALTLVLLGSRGAYRPRIAPNFLEDVRTIIATTAVAAMTVSFFKVLAENDINAGSQAVRVWLFICVYVIAARGGIRLEEKQYHRFNVGRPTLIIGAGEIGHLLGRRMLESRELGLRPVGFADDRPLTVKDPADLPVLGSTADLERLVSEHRIEHAVLAFSRASHLDDLATSRRLIELGVSVSIVPRLFEGVPDRIALERAGGLPMLSIYPSNPKGWQFEFKYLLGRAAALVLLVLISPLLLVIALGTLLTLGRPILFKQERVGLDGREFGMYKFRTMRDGGDPEQEDGAADAAMDPAVAESIKDGALAPGGVEGVDRRTRFGTFLRRTSLDELPQLLNVIRDDMTLVGPRPERTGFVRIYDPEVYRYADRHRAKSGITGWAQVHGLRGKTSLPDRVEWDNYYIENWSLWLDFKILLMTVRAVLRDRAE
jgi:exopolysaccharide biosynthesis polyprenyl glycosylphosphotransferase